MISKSEVPAFVNFDAIVFIALGEMYGALPSPIRSRTGRKRSSHCIREATPSTRRTTYRCSGQDRIIVNSILKLVIALTACDWFAGRRTASVV